MNETIQTNVKKIVDAAHTVPSLPENVLDALHEIDRPDSNVADIAGYIEQDVGLTSKILKLANSAYYGFSNRVVSIPHALALLGIKTTKSTLLTASMDDFFQKLPERTKKEARHLWRHSIVCASAAKLVARQIPDADPEEAFVAALLHDIGISVLFVNMPREFRKILDLAGSENIGFRQAERKFWPYTHDLIGAEVLRRWDLPDRVPQSVETHHTFTPTETDEPLAAVVYLADRVALAPETEDMVDGYFTETAASTHQLFNLTADRVAEWLVEVLDSGKEEAEVLLAVLQ